MSEPLAVEKKNNGHGGARPGAGRPLKYPEGIKRQIQRSREVGIQALPSVVAFWIKSLRDPNLDWQFRNRAAENLANRCGLPIKAIADVRGDGVGLREMVLEALRNQRSTHASEDEPGISPSTVQ